MLIELSSSSSSSFAWKMSTSSPKEEEENLHSNGKQKSKEVMSLIHFSPFRSLFTFISHHQKETLHSFPSCMGGSLFFSLAYHRYRPLSYHRAGGVRGVALLSFQCGVGIRAVGGVFVQVGVESVVVCLSVCNGESFFIFFFLFIV